MHIKALLSSCKLIKVVELPDKVSVEEGDDPRHNAWLKAACAFKSFGGPVIASDESLYLEGLLEHEQPRAFIRRVVGKNFSDARVIDYYSAVFEKLDVNQLNGTLINYFSVFNKSGKSIDLVLVESLLFKYPPSSKFIINRPLSAFHYIKQHNCFFSELSNQNSERFISKSGKDIAAKVCSFLCS